MINAPNNDDITDDDMDLESDFDAAFDDDDDLDLDLDMDDDDFENGGGKTGGFKALWNDNPLVKIGVIIGAIILVILIMMSFGGGSDDSTQQSRVGGGSDISAAPGTEESSPAYIEAVEESNEETIETAFATGGSAIPVPIDAPVGRVDITPQQQTDEEDPLARWRRLQEERLAREIEETQNAPEVFSQEEIFVENPVDTQAVIQALSDVMSQQMQSILEGKTVAQISQLQVTAPDYLEQQALQQAQFAQQQQIAQGNNATNGAAGTVGSAPQAKPIVSAGEILYAQLITEANSDIPGPIMATIAGGKLDGARILGEFEVQKNLLTLTFSTIVIDGIATSMDGVALDPSTTLPGIATEVNHRYLRRVILPAAAAFIEGAADAISESGLTTVTVDGGAAVESQDETDSEQEISAGVSEAGQEIREILDELADETEVLVRIASGTPIGLLLLEGIYAPGEGPSNNPTQTSSGFGSAPPAQQIPFQLDNFNDFIGQ